ncbi:MAG: four helix bundle protein [Candidatus Yanofskybacteria bacterium]|nr:four helix bundle protein [Candidatus Yanofskybacteria bacterium]
MVNSYKDLTVWQRSLELVKEIYKTTRFLPKDEIYGLTNQMRRAAISIPSNIAEGHQRKNLKEYLQFLRISYGSAAELETQLIISKEIYPRIDFLTAESLLKEVHKMLNTLIQKLELKF